MLLCLFTAQFRSPDYQQMSSVVYFDFGSGSLGEGWHSPTDCEKPKCSN